jgi:hypothetical protein
LNLDIIGCFFSSESVDVDLGRRPGGIIGTMLSLLPCAGFNGVRGESAIRMFDLNGDWLTNEAFGGFSTTLVLALWRGRRGFDVWGIGAWLIIDGAVRS